MLINVIVSLLLLGLAVVVLSGRGDKLIAGYNTLSPEERERYHVRRLRWVVAVTIILWAALLHLPSLLHKDGDVMTVMATMAYGLIITIVAIVLCNTWCKR